jgi:tetratricopeptide (TPR) repeat protein
MASGDQQWAEALDWWQTSLALQPGQVSTLRKAGQTAYRLERYERALDLLTQAVELDQGLSVEQKIQDYTMLAEEAEKLGDTERATELSRRAGR